MRTQSNVRPTAQPNRQPLSAQPLALVFAAGEAPIARLMPELLLGADIVVAADGGLAHAAAYGLVPDRIVGDLDSVDPGLLQRFEKVPVERHPVAKDELDLELALLAARELGAGSFRVLGAFGGRLDHSLAALLVAARWAEAGHAISLHGAGHEAHIVLPGQSLNLRLAPGTTVSLLALRDEAVLDSRGLLFPLSRTTVPWGGGLGMSNEVIDGDVEIGCSSGMAALIIEHEV